MPNKRPHFDYEQAVRIAEYIANDGYFPAEDRSKHHGMPAWERLCPWTEHCSMQLTVRVLSDGYILGSCDCCPVGGQMVADRVAGIRKGIKCEGIGHLDRLIKQQRAFRKQFLSDTPEAVGLVGPFPIGASHPDGRPGAVGGPDTAAYAGGPMGIGRPNGLSVRVAN